MVVGWRQDPTMMYTQLFLPTILLFFKDAD